MAARGAPGVIIDGGSQYTDFQINAGASAAIDGLTIQNGKGTGVFGGFGSPVPTWNVRRRWHRRFGFSQSDKFEGDQQYGDGWERRL